MLNFIFKKKVNLFIINHKKYDTFQVQHQDIIVQLPCPTPNGTAALHYYGLLHNEALPFHFRHFGPAWNAMFCYIVPAVITVFAFVCIGRICSKKSQKIF